jgi:hypothetical protein
LSDDELRAVTAAAVFDEVIMHDPLRSVAKAARDLSTKGRAHDAARRSSAVCGNERMSLPGHVCNEAVAGSLP